MMSIQLVIQNLALSVMKLPLLQRVLTALNKAKRAVSRLFIRAVGQHEVEAHLRPFPQLVAEIHVGAVVGVDVAALLNAQSGGHAGRAVTIYNRLINRAKVALVIQAAEHTQLVSE